MLEKKLKEKSKMKTKILIISTLLGFPVIAQSSLLTDNSYDKVIKVNLIQRNALVPDNSFCSVDEIKILDSPPYIIYKEKPDGYCCKVEEEKFNKDSEAYKVKLNNEGEKI